MKKTITLIFSLLSALLVQAQADCSMGRYSQAIFPDVTLTSGVEYGENANPSNLNPNARQTLFLDVYEPMGDTLSQRPLLIFAFGGGFVFGSRTSPDIVYLCREFAKLGYVTAAIDYRLTLDLLAGGSERLGTLATLKGTHDMRAAVRFFRKDAATTDSFRIDPERIYVGGVSAGAFCALHTAYLDQESEIPASITADTVGLGGLEGLSGNLGFSSEVKGVINLCGALGDKSWMEPGDQPLVSLHGTADATVPYGQDTVTLLGINQVVAGSGALHTYIDTAGLGFDHALYTWEGIGHTPFVEFSGIVPTYMDTTFRFVRDFLYEQECGLAANIEKPLENTRISSFPNPFFSTFTLRIQTSSPQQLQLQLLDLQGRGMPVASHQEGNELRVEGSNLPAGLYIWQLRNARGQLLGRGKLVKR